jgi:hypothetical protein
MKYTDSHLSDEQLLLSVDGEFGARDEKRVRAHLDACWKCRTRRKELEDAIADSVRVYHREFDSEMPPVKGPRALLRARIAQISQEVPGGFERSRWFGWGVPALGALLLLGFYLAIPRLMPRTPGLVVSKPDATLTPGAALMVNRREVCGRVTDNNKPVSPAIQRAVFAEYGIAGADPRAYEVDYLVTPALGGADDIHNLWPHSHTSTVWNAQVKDALEDRLRDLVCEGSLDLADAQREIASDWIGAYRKYFHTDRPLAQHHK